MLEKNDLQDVLSNGGFTIKPLDIGLVKSLEDEMKKLFGQQNVGNDEFLSSLNACTDDRIAQLFDIFNCCGNILSGHYAVQSNYVETVFENPLIWTYPNVRIDKVSRDKFITSLAKKNSGYYWHLNFGYGTKQHLGAIKKLGVSKHHRKTFAPIRK